MSRKALWYLSVAAIFLAPAAAAAGDAGADNQNSDFSLEGQNGQEDGAFTLEGEPGMAEEKEEPSWKTQAEVDYSSEIEAGVFYNSANSFKEGEYTGITDRAPYGIGNFDVRLRSPYNSEDTEFLHMQGSHLGLDSREVRIEGGSQGTIKGYIDYNQIPKFLSDSAMTPYVNAGSTFQTLPSNWVVGGAGTGTAAMTSLVPDLQPIDLSYDRKQLGAGFEYIVAPHWRLSGDYQHEWKDGLKSIGATFGFNGGNPRSVVLAEPIDYLTDQATLTLAYADDMMQGQLSYYVSLFNNQDSSLTWQGAFPAVGGGNGWAPAAGFPTGFGRMALAPDNQFHQINLSGAYNIDPETSTRANLDLSYGWMLQNQSFLPYTVNPALTVTNQLPRNSLDGEINTTLVNLRLTSHPWDDVHLRGGLRYDDRANNTPIALYNYIGGDSQNQVTAAGSDRFRYNRPYSYAEYKLDVEGDYDFMPHTTGTLGYEFDRIHRTFQERKITNEHTGSVRFKTMPVDLVTVSVNGAYGIRTGTPYDAELSEQYGFLFPPAVGMNHLMTKFYEANRDRTRVGGDVLVMPTDYVSIGLRADYVHDEFPDSPLGVQDRDAQTYTVDASYVPMNALTTYAYYTLNYIRTDQSNRSFNNAATQLNPARDWFVTTNDTVDTAGVGLDWEAIKDKLDINFDYTYSKADTGYNFDSPTLAHLGIPSLKSTFQSAGVLGTYHFRKDIALKLGYRYETYRTYDFALDNVAPNTLSNVITMGDVSPDYTAHIVGTSVAFQF